MRNNRILICLVSEQTLPNFLFIKEMFLPGDEILLITSYGYMEEKAEFLKKALGWANTNIEVRTFSEKGIENDFERLCKEMSFLSTIGNQCIANLTGGTKLMSLALYKQLEKKTDSELYYMPFPKMMFHQIAPTFKNIPIQSKLTVNDYFTMYGIGYKPSKHGCTEPQEVAETCFKRFTSVTRSKSEAEAMETLRVKFRNEKKSVTPDRYNEVAAAVDYLSFKPSEANQLTKKEVEYLTGGWFEEWAYYIIKEHLKLDNNSIAINPHISFPGRDTNSNRDNELDVVFINDNQLYIVECKSGIENREKLNNYLDKANSIKQLTRSLSCNSALFAIVGDNDNWRKTSETVGIYYLDKEKLLDPEKRYSFIKK